MTVDARRPPLLRLLPTPPARYAEGMSREARVVDAVDALAPVPTTRTTAHGGWGTGHALPRTVLTLPEQEASRLAPTVTSPAATSFDHPLPFNRMATTRRLDLLVPVADNEGHLFNPDDLASFEDRLIALAGGFTRRGRISGVWQSPTGQVFTDESLAYSVTVPSDVADSVTADVTRYIQTRFRQELAWIESVPTFVAAV